MDEKLTDMKSQMNDKFENVKDKIPILNMSQPKYIGFQEYMFYWNATWISIIAVYFIPDLIFHLFRRNVSLDSKQLIWFKRPISLILLILVFLHLQQQNFYQPAPSTFSMANVKRLASLNPKELSTEILQLSE